MINPDNRERLSALTSQASALAYTLYGGVRESFIMFSEDTQNSILWLLSDLLQEIDDIVNGEADHD